MNVHDNGDGWFSQVNWTGNPFTLEIKPSLMVGYSEELKKLMQYVDEGHKHIVVTGPTGSGKTTLLKWLSEKYRVMYLPKPPAEPGELVSIFRTTVLKPTLWERIFGSESVNLYNITEKLNARNKGSRVLLLVDEAHETSVPVLEWLRTISDQSEGMTLILAGLPKLKEEKMKNLETLSQRISMELELGALSKDDTINLVRKRISSVGGASLEPFTLDALVDVYHHTGGFPREVLKACDTLVHRAMERGSLIIDKSVFEESERSDTVVEVKDSIDGLTDKQQQILNLVLEKERTPSQVVSSVQEGYQSKSHALRAVNNILKRLLKSKLIIRERRGKTFVYKVSPRMKSVVVAA